VTNNCAKPVSCGQSCGGTEICGVGNATTCGCPPRALGLYAFHNPTTFFHCYGTDVSQCPNDPVDGLVGTIHNQPFASLVPLYRCHGTNNSFLLTTNANCNGSASYAFEGLIGFCAPTPVCGSFPLVVNVGTSGDVIYLRGGTTVSGYTPVGTVCNVWQ